MSISRRSSQILCESAKSSVSCHCILRKHQLAESRELVKVILAHSVINRI